MNAKIWLGVICRTNVLAADCGPRGYAVSWKAGGISSGLYVYRLSAGGKSLSRMMILVR
ncbi:MAG: hypothetical protein OEM41_10550 [Ignavibacteria bacterium]|nr:hypothetical protein [Ignavibacteria bacterium]